MSDGMITWVKPSGAEITTRDTPQIRELAALHEWKEKQAKRARKRPTRVEYSDTADEQGPE
jgi:uncharacterized protein YcbX